MLAPGEMYVRLFGCFGDKRKVLWQQYAAHRWKSLTSGVTSTLSSALGDDFAELAEAATSIVGKVPGSSAKDGHKEDPIQEAGHGPSFPAQLFDAQDRPDGAATETATPHKAARTSAASSPEVRTQIGSSTGSLSAKFLARVLGGVNKTSLCSVASCRARPYHPPS